MIKHAEIHKIKIENEIRFIAKVYIDREEMGVNESELDNTPIQVDENETYDKSDIDDAEIVEENDDSGDPF